MGGGGPPRTAVRRAPPAATSGVVGTAPAVLSAFSGRVRRSVLGFSTGRAQAASKIRDIRKLSDAHDLHTVMSRQSILRKHLDANDLPLAVDRDAGRFDRTNHAPVGEILAGMTQFGSGGVFSGLSYQDNQISVGPVCDDTTDSPLH